MRRYALYRVPVLVINSIIITIIIIITITISIICTIIKVVGCFQSFWSGAYFLLI